MENNPTLTINTQSEACAATVDELKAQLRYESDGEDSLIETYLRVCSEYIERISGHALLSRRYTQSFRGFLESEIELLRYPVTSVDSILYRDSSGAEQTLPATSYALSQSKPARLRLKAGQSSLATDLSPDSVRVSFTAGYTPETLPPELKQAIIFTAAHFFENRTPFIQINGMTEVPLTLKALIDAIKVFFTV